MLFIQTDSVNSIHYISLAIKLIQVAYIIITLLTWHSSTSLKKPTVIKKQIFCPYSQSIECRTNINQLQIISVWLKVYNVQSKLRKETEGMNWKSEKVQSWKENLSSNSKADLTLLKDLTALRNSICYHEYI